MPKTQNFLIARNSAEVSFKSDIFELPETGTFNKLFFIGKLMYTFEGNETNPNFRWNDNGEGYDFEQTKEVYETAKYGYGNYNHTDKIVGNAIDGKWITLEEENGAVIVIKGVIHKDLLKRLIYEYYVDYDTDIQQDIIDGLIKISTEVYYSDWYYVWGDKRYSKEEGYFLENYVGRNYKGNFVGRMIYPKDINGFGITYKPAEKQAEVLKAVAKQKEKNEGVENIMPFKVFETEEQYNDHMKVATANVKENLMKDESFIKQIREDLKNDETVKSEAKEAVKEIVREELENEIKQSTAADVIEKFKTIGIEAENIDGIIQSVSSINEKLNEIMEKQRINENIVKLKELGLDNEEMLQSTASLKQEVFEATYNVLKNTTHISQAKNNPTNNENDLNMKQSTASKKFDPNFGVKEDSYDSRADIVNYVG